MHLARAGAVQARTAALNQLDDLLVTAPAELRRELTAKTLKGKASQCADWQLDGDRLAEPVQAARSALGSIARRISSLTTRSGLIRLRGGHDPKLGTLPRLFIVMILAVLTFWTATNIATVIADANATAFIEHRSPERIPMTIVSTDRLWLSGPGIIEEQLDQDQLPVHRAGVDGPRRRQDPFDPQRMAAGQQPGHRPLGKREDVFLIRMATTTQARSRRSEASRPVLVPR